MIAMMSISPRHIAPYSIAGSGWVHMLHLHQVSLLDGDSVFAPSLSGVWRRRMARLNVKGTAHLIHLPLYATVVPASASDGPPANISSLWDAVECDHNDRS